VECVDFEVMDYAYDILSARGELSLKKPLPQLWWILVCGI
jgi:hypothetical protein